MNTPDELQTALEGWNGTGDPPRLSTVQAAPGYQALSPAGRVAAINQTQRNWADRLRADDPKAYGDQVRDLEADTAAARQTEVENGLAADLAAGKFTDSQVRDYTAGRVSLENYPQQQELAGPWVTHKLPLSGADGKPRGYAYIRHAPDLTEGRIQSGLRSVMPNGDAAPPEWNYAMARYAGDPNSDRVEVSWSFRGNDNKDMAGVDDVNVGRVFADVATGRNHYGPLYGQNPAEKETSLLASVPEAMRPAMAATTVFSGLAASRPEIADKIGQGFWAGLPGEAAKGFLSLGNTAINAPAALAGNLDAARAWQQGQQDLESDIEGQSRLAFRGALSDKVLQGISGETIPMAFSAGAGALGAAARKALTSAVGKTFLSRMAALEMEQAAKQGITGLTREAAAKMLAGELTGEGVGTSARQGLASSLARGYLGKWLGTAEIEGPLARQLADRVSNAVAFLPSSARAGLDNMATTLNKAAELRDAGKEDEARAMEAQAVANGWAGVGMETLSENIWLNEMLVTRAGHSLSRVTNDVLERTLRPGMVSKLAQRGKQFLKAALVEGNKEGVEEIFSGVSGRAWMNAFAGQNQDLLADVPAEYLTGAVMGGLLSGARDLAHDGQPEAFRALVTRGIDGDAGALAALARIRARAEAMQAEKTFATGETGDGGTSPGGEATPSPTPAAAVTRLANIAGNVPPPAVQGDATEQAAGEMNPSLVPPAPTDLPPAELSPEGTSPAPQPDNSLRANTQAETAPAMAGEDPGDIQSGNLFPVPQEGDTGAMAAPAVTVGTPENPPVPDPPETIEAQARMAADPSSSRKAVLITPGSQRPARIPGLVAFKGESPHGLVLYNPKKITPAEVRKAAQAPVFDASILGQTGQTPAAATMAVTASLPGAPNVHAELVPDNDPAALAAAVSAAQAAVPGGTIAVQPAAAVMATRRTKAPANVQNPSPNTDQPAPRSGQEVAQAQAQPQAPETGAADATTAQPAPAGEVARDRTRLEQLTPEENAAAWEFAKAKGSRTLVLMSKDGTEIQQVKDQKNGKLTASPEAIMRKVHESRIRDTFLSDNRPPVSAAAVEAYGIELPKGYVKDGELYVYRKLNTRDANGNYSREFLNDMAKRVKRDTASEGMMPKGPDRIQTSRDASSGPPAEGKAGVTDAFAADARAMLRQNAPEILRGVRFVRGPQDLQQEDYHPDDWQTIIDGGTEAFYRPATGETIVLLDFVTPRPGETQIGAVTRVILHERLAHAGLALLRKADPEFAKAWRSLTDMIPPEELAALLPIYPHLAEQPDRLAEEWFARHAEAARIAPPASLLGRIWAALKAALQRIWQGLRPGPLSLDERVQEMLRASLWALRTQRTAPTEESGVMKSAIAMSALDAEYMAAVQAGDMEKAQAMVDAAAKAAGYNVGPVWHGTNGDFSAFDPNARNVTDYGFAGKGFYFTTERDGAGNYGSRVIKAVLRLVNPLIVPHSFLVESKAEAVAFSQNSRANGHDGIIREFASGSRKGIPFEYVVFDPNQIKSAEPITRDATGNVIPLSRRFDASRPELMYSRNPFERRDWSSVPIPAWLAAKLGATAPAPYTVTQQGFRAILTGSRLPAEFARMVARTQDEIRAVTERGAILGRDLQVAMDAYATRSGLTAQQVADAVNAALMDPVLMAALPDDVVRTRAIAARNFVDTLSAEIAATTGGTLAKTIMDNAGHWLRRGYAVFDSAAGWDAKAIREAAAAGKMLAGRDARRILTDARAWIRTNYPALTTDRVEAMISDLTNRDAWQSDALGIPRPDGARVTREVSSFMRRKDIPAPIRALMGEERNPIARLNRSIGIQAQLIARYDQQRAMRDMGLRMGIFRTTADGTYHKPVGGSDAGGNMRWNGFAWTDPATGKTQPVYTTPEMLAAMQTASVADGRDLGAMFLRAYKALGTEAKMNKVALNPDSWAVNIMGNILGMVQSGDTFHFAGWQRIAEAVRLHRSSGANSGEAVNAVAEAVRDVQRALVGRMAAAGVANASFDMQDLQASLDNSVLAFIEGSQAANRTAGAVRGAVIGQSLGRAFGPGMGQAIGGAVGGIAGAVAGGKAITGAQKAIAKAVLSSPDNIGKIAVFLGNYASHLAAGDADSVAFQRAAEKTRNTMPDYSKLPALLKEASKLGLLGSFIAFQHEVYRNYYWNVRYALQELRSGNAALVARGIRRMLGAATVTALGGGLLSVIAGAVGAGADDERDQAYRRSLGAPWERFGELAYTHLDNKSASFFNTSYLVPQTTLFEIFRAASEGKNFGDAMANAASAIGRQFASGSVHADPVLEAMMNTRMSGGPVTYEEGAAGVLERLAHVVKVSLEPGATNKAERIGHALRQESIRGRNFSLTEEALRMIGVRQSTYQHDDRIRNKLYEMRDTLQNARAQARKMWKDTPQPADRQAAIDRANDRITEAETRYREFMADMHTLGIPRTRVDSIRKDVGLSPDFHHLKPGANGPETAQ